MNTQPVTLGYWKIRGLAQQIRYLLEYLEVPYKEVFYETWEEWSKAGPNLGIILYNLPYFFDGDYKLTESGAIMKYISRKWGKDKNLEGKTTEDFGLVEQMVGELADIKSNITRTCYGDGDVKALKENVNPEFGAVEKCLEGKKFVMGDYVTYVDFILYEMNNLMEYVSGKTHFETFPKLKEFNQNMASLEKIAQYHKSDRKLELRFNGKSAKI